MTAEAPSVLVGLVLVRADFSIGAKSSRSDISRS
jgi:hypothetical protein